MQSIQKISKEYFAKIKFKFDLHINSIQNLYYYWKNTASLFKWNMIFENNKTKSNNIFLQSYYYTFLYDINSKKYYMSIYILYICQIFL